MKVNPHVQGNSQTSQAHATRSQTGSEKAKGKEASSSRASDGASAEISARAREMAMAKKLASQPDASREEKIAELKRQIANKEYKVNAEAVADRLVDEHLATGDL